MPRLNVVKRGSQYFIRNENKEIVSQGYKTMSEAQAAKDRKSEGAAERMFPSMRKRKK